MYKVMYANNLPDDTIAITNIQDKALIMRDLGLPLHLADGYGTIFITENNGSYAHHKIKVHRQARLENLSETVNYYHVCSPEEQEDWGTVHSEAYNGECICERCKELKNLS